MVNLANIRKKAKKKEKGEAQGAEGGAAPTSEAPAPEPVAAPAAAPEPLAAPTTPQAETRLERFKQTAGRLREQATVEQQQEQTAAQIELLTFSIAGENYAVDIEHIVEIVRPRAVTRIPNADPSIVGILSLRGTIVTLVDVRAKLRHPPMAAETEDTRIVVVDLHGEMLGFTVDRVHRVIKTTEGEIEPHPVVHVSEQDVAIRGVFRVAGALTILVDLDKLLDSRALAAAPIA